jgi:hypothetical protein
MTRFAKLAFVVAAATTAACSDSVAPSAESSISASGASTIDDGGAMASLTARDTLRFTIKINPKKRTTFSLGAGNTLVFPQSSVCDPETSGYGPTSWDTPCTPITKQLAVSVKAWLDPQGHPRTDFSPNIRFVPSDVPNNWVIITFSDWGAALDPMYKILYCTDAYTGPCVDESKSDPSLLTVEDPITGQLTRRIKHFSGYLVGAGDDQSSLGMFNKVGAAPIAPLMSRKPSGAGVNKPTAKGRTSGYILVSG